MSDDAKAGSAIVLAAGFSRRFGRDKRLEPLGQDTLLAHTCRLYTAIFDRVIAVLRPGEFEIASLLPESVEVVPSIHAIEGISQSLVAGVRAAIDSPWIVVALGDMPYVQKSTLRLLRSTLETCNEHVVRLKHFDRVGNPVGFPSKYFDILLGLTGNHGAKALLESGSLTSQVLVVDDPGILVDLDHPDDLQAHTDC